MTRSGTVASLRFAILLAVVALHGPVRAQAGAVLVTKTFRTVSDPMGSLSPRNIPGAVIDYTITVTNRSGSRLDDNSVLIETISPGTEFSVSDLVPLIPIVPVIGLPSLAPGPVDFDPISGNGVSYRFYALNSTTDSIDFSSDNQKSWTYVPSPNGSGYDPAVTAIRITLTTGLRAGQSYSVRFRVRLR